MDPHRWQRIRMLFEGALALDEAARRAWLDEVLADLVRSGVAAFDGADVVDA